jgi:integrase
MDKLLVDSTIKKAKGRAKQYTIGDGTVRGLFLVVLPNGAKYFRFRYSLAGRSRLMQLGRWPEVTLAKAREQAAEFRVGLKEHVDPITARRIGKSQKIWQTRETFAAVAAMWIDKQDWKPRNLKRVQGNLRRYLLPKLAPLPIKDIDRRLLEGILDDMQKKGIIPSLHQVRQTLNSVFKFAIRREMLTTNPTPVVETVKKRPPVRHQPALAFDEIGPFLRKLKASGVHPVTQAALRLTMLLGLRDHTLRAANWSEIDLEAASWNCPATNMKGRKGTEKAYTTPLPAQAVAILRNLYELTFDGPDSPVFKGAGKTGRMSAGTMCMAVHAIGFNATAHGMRATMRDYLEAECEFSTLAIKTQHAQVVGNAVDRAYQRSKFWNQRVRMLQHWANVVEAVEHERPVPGVVDNVTNLRAA